MTNENVNLFQVTTVQEDNIPLIIKSEKIDDSNSPVPNPAANSENDDSLPDYENSMLARSLLSGNRNHLSCSKVDGSFYNKYKSCLK